MSLLIVSSVIPRCCTSHSNNIFGITPFTSPPSSITLSAMVPIKPALPPPYISFTLCFASNWPSSAACWVNKGLVPALEPQKTASDFIDIVYVNYCKGIIKFFIFKKYYESSFVDRIKDQI